MKIVSLVALALLNAPLAVSLKAMSVTLSIKRNVFLAELVLVSALFPLQMKKMNNLKSAHRGFFLKELLMKNLKLNARAYSKGEEIFNMISHIVGGALGIVALVLCIVFSAIHKNCYAIVSSIIYGTMMIILYTMSSIYHGLNPNIKAKKVFQLLDHCSIFLLIAGSYTPFCLVTFRTYNSVLGWTIFSIIWTMAILGIVLNCIDIKKYETFSMICYLGMGWCIIFTAKLLAKLLGPYGIILLTTGGIAYTVGAILYVIGKRKKYMHSIFHLFIVLGSILHFFCILFYVI